MKVGNIALVRLTANDDIIGTITHYTNDSIGVHLPMYIAYTISQISMKAGIKLAPYVQLTKDENLTFDTRCILCVATPNDLLVKYYKDHIKEYTKWLSEPFYDLTNEIKDFAFSNVLKGLETDGSKAN